VSEREGARERCTQKEKKKERGRGRERERMKESAHAHETENQREQGRETWGERKRGHREKGRETWGERKRGAEMGRSPPRVSVVSSVASVAGSGVIEGEGLGGADMGLSLARL